MCPRRPPRRPPFHGRVPPHPRRKLAAVAPPVREALMRAHQALERGETARAAGIFRRLAGEFVQRGMPVRAAAMALEAAHAEALGGEAEEAVGLARRALSFFADRPLPERLAAVTGRLLAALRQDGHEAQAAEVEGMLGTAARLSEAERRQERPRGGRKSRLPAKCTACGGPLLPDEVVWHGAGTVECPYCGSVVREE